MSNKARLFGMAPGILWESQTWTTPAQCRGRDFWGHGQFFLRAICFHCVPGACEQHCNAKHRHDLLLDRQADCRKYNVGHAQHGMLNPGGPWVVLWIKYFGLSFLVCSYIILDYVLVPRVFNSITLNATNLHVGHAQQKCWACPTKSLNP